jgi:hypothetical protein
VDHSEKCGVGLDAGFGSGRAEQFQVRSNRVSDINRQIEGFSQSLMRILAGGDIIW